MVDYDLKKWFAYSGLRYDKLNDLSWILLLGLHSGVLYYGETSLGNKFYCFSPRESPIAIRENERNGRGQSDGETIKSGSSIGDTFLIIV